MPRTRELRAPAVLAVALGLALVARPARAADPEPTNASILGATATLVPIALGTTLLYTGRGEDEGVRLASALSAINLGTIVGPMAGQLYAGSGVDAVVTLLLRTLTSGIGTTGVVLAYRGSSDDRPTAIALMALGGATTLVIAGFDIIDAADTARESRIRVGDRREIRELASIAACGAIPCGAP